MFRRHPVRSIIFGLVAFVVVVSAIAGTGSKPKHATTSKDSPALVTDSTPAPKKAAPPAPAHPQVFTGTGTENIGSIKVPTDSTLDWSCPTCASDNFVIENDFSDDNNIAVNGLDQTSGTTVIDAGTYTKVQVITEGQDWKLTITPGT